MSTLDTQAEAAMGNLLKYDEKQLYHQLGVYTKVLADDPTKAGVFDLQVTDQQASMMGLRDSLEEFGKRLYQRWNREAYNLVCGAEGADAEDRKKILESFGVSEVMVGAAITAFLVSSLGLAPLIATVVAAIAVKRFFRPGYEEFCAVWKKNLPEPHG